MRAGGAAAARRRQTTTGSVGTQRAKTSDFPLLCRSLGIVVRASPPHCFNPQVCMGATTGSFSSNTMGTQNGRTVFRRFRRIHSVSVFVCSSNLMSRTRYPGQPNTFVQSLSLNPSSVRTPPASPTPV